MSHIQVMFNPKTIALIGATEKEGAVGRTILENLLRSKERRIFPVNPHTSKVLDVGSYPTIAGVPEHVDLAVVATPARSVPEVVEECGQAGVEGVVRVAIISARFKEIGEEGTQLESEIDRIRKKYGMRIMGPNCLGFVRPVLGLNATFLRGNPLPGNIAFISQSGALGSAILDWAVSAGIGFSMFASLGSMIDVDFGDMIDFLGDDPATRSILIYMEGVGNARKFMSAARAFARRKPIIILKPGRFAESARAAHSHTGAMAGDNAVYEAAFRRAGAVRVGEIAELSEESMKQLNAFLPPYWSKAILLTCLETQPSTGSRKPSPYASVTPWWTECLSFMCPWTLPLQPSLRKRWPIVRKTPGSLSSQRGWGQKTSRKGDAFLLRTASRPTTLLRRLSELM